jgi:clan AA aspartic protease (TIGR02281 family)
MVVDTGATYVMIPWYIAHELGYKPGQSREWVTIATGNGMILIPKLCVESLSVLGLKVENLAVVCHDLPPAARVDGLLGLSYLRNFNLRIDFKNGILELEKY